MRSLNPVCVLRARALAARPWKHWEGTRAPSESERAVVGTLRRSLVVLCLSLVAHPLGAQSAEHVGGTVRDTAGTLLAAVMVTITRGPDRLTLRDSTTATGQFSIRFDPGTGDYLVHVSAPGYQTFRKRVTRTPAGKLADSSIVVEVRLVPAVTSLARVTVVAQRELPPREGRGDPPVGTPETLVEGVVGSIAPDAIGSLNATLRMLPGVVTTPGGLSVLGARPDENISTLNGMTFAGRGIPRDARTRVRLLTTPFDPAIGGFSGGQAAVELAPGGEYETRSSHVSSDVPGLAAGGTGRWIDRHATMFNASVGGDGPIGRSGWVYNGGLQVRGQSTGLDGLEADVSPSGIPRVLVDSALSVMQALLGSLERQFLEARQAERASMILRLDHGTDPDAKGETPPTAFGLTAHAEAGRTVGAGVSDRSSRSQASNVTDASGLLMGYHSIYRGLSLVETKSAVTYTFGRLRSVTDLPALNVTVMDRLAPGADYGESLSFGGGDQRSLESELGWETTTQVSWAPASSQHRWKATAGLRLERLDESNLSGMNGTFTYGSLADVPLNRPVAFRRTLEARDAATGSRRGWVSIGDVWRPSPGWRLQYGVRGEVDRTAGNAVANDDIVSQFERSSRQNVTNLGISPRLAFTWTYGTVESAPSTSVGLLGRFRNPQRGVVHGGVGAFQGRLSQRLFLEPQYNSGLPGANAVLECVGDQTPEPAWPTYVEGAASIPTVCRSGSPSSTSSGRLSQVDLVANDFAAPLVWRGALGWYTGFGPLTVGLDATVSRAIHQASLRDLNLREAPAFRLREEAGRPVYVDPTAIDAASGQVPMSSSRRVGAYGTVFEHLSDLRSESRQLAIRITPITPMLARHRLSAVYTIAQATRQIRGFSESTGGDPSVVEWVPGAYDVRHQFVLQAGTVLWNKVSITGSAQLMSGVPFTPLIGTDVNGDGLVNDRAFIFHPDSIASSQPGLAAALRGMMDGDGRVAKCLREQLGTIAGASTCDGPWTTYTNLRLDYTGLIHVGGHAVRAGLNVANPIAGVDLLLHGAAKSHGWGQPALVDAVLLQPSAFDAAGGRYHYRVNRGFGQSLPGPRVGGNLMRLTLDVSVNLGTPIVDQMLSRVLQGTRSADGKTVRSPVEIRQRYARTVPNIYIALLNESDSLLLVSAQTDTLLHYSQEYDAQVAVIWTALGRYLAALPPDYDPAAARGEIERATDAAWEVVRLQIPIIRTTLTPMQLALTSGIVRYILNSKGKIQLRVY